MSGYTTQVPGDRLVDVTHPDGHRWFFQFPTSWGGGHVPRYAPTQYVNDERPDDPFIDKSAATAALEVAFRQGWIRR